MNSREDFYSKLRSTIDSKMPYRFTNMIIKISAQSEKNTAEIVDAKAMEFLIITGMCGGDAKRMACDESLRNYKLVPMGSIAACLSHHNVLSTDPIEYFPRLKGQVFCFLPLPAIVTNIPVHMNAYWELSSNRRDIWRGDDTKGEAKLRSGCNYYFFSYFIN
jgi:sacsin